MFAADGLAEGVRLGSNVLRRFIEFFAAKEGAAVIGDKLRTVAKAARRPKS